MALTRKFLRALGIEDDKIDEIINAHAETVTALKNDRDALQEKADASDDLRKQLESLKSDADTIDDLRKQVDAAKTELAEYRASVDQRDAAAAKEAAYRSILARAGIDPKRMDAIVRVSDMDAIEIDNGDVVNADDLIAKAKTEWSDFVVATNVTSAPVDTPPAVQPAQTEPTSLAEALHQKYHL